MSPRRGKSSFSIACDRKGDIHMAIIFVGKINYQNLIVLTGDYIILVTISLMYMYLVLHYSMITPSTKDYDYSL